MADGQEFMHRLEKRFEQMSAEEKLNKMVEYQKRLTELKMSGLTEEAAVAWLEQEIRDLPEPAAEPTEDYGSIHHPKKPLLTGVLYTVALAAVVAAAALFTYLFR